MPSRNDALIWESSPRSFGIGYPGSLIRCPAEIAPKRINEAKLVATVARSAFVPYPHPVRSGPVVCPNADKTLVRSLLRDLPLVTFLSSDWSSCIKWLTKITSAQVATVVGSFMLPRDPDMERFAESLIRFNPEWQRLALQKAAQRIDYLANDPSAGTSLIGEDRPGKLLRVEPRLQALRYMAKKWTQVLSREGDINTKTIVAEPGWGAGALVVEPDGNRHIACCEFDISGRELHLAAADHWAQRIQEWVVHTSGLEPAQIQHIKISTPYLVIAGYMAEALTSRGQTFPAAPDLVWGWHPLLTLLEFLMQAKEPSILINLHHGSGLQIALVW